MPAEAKFSVPGFAFAAATRSATRLESFRRCRDQHARLHAEQDDGLEILERVVGQRPVQDHRGTHRRAGEQDGVAVRLGPRHRGGADNAAGAGPVLDDKRLAKLLLSLIEHDAGNDVVGGARGERADHQDRARRPLLAPPARRPQATAGRGNGDAH